MTTPPIKPADLLDSKPFTHRCSNGTEASIERCDLRGTLKLQVPKRLTEEQLIADVAELVVWHSINIWPQLAQQRPDYVRNVQIVRV